MTSITNLQLATLQEIVRQGEIRTIRPIQQTFWGELKPETNFAAVAERAGLPSFLSKCAGEREKRQKLSNSQQRIE